MRKFASSLDGLNRYAKKDWVRLNANRNHLINVGIRVRRESEGTMSKYGHEKLFLNENGEFFLYFDSTGSRRVYFKELPEKKYFLSLELDRV